MIPESLQRLKKYIFLPRYSEKQRQAFARVKLVPTMRPWSVASWSVINRRRLFPDSSTSQSKNTKTSTDLQLKSVVLHTTEAVHVSLLTSTYTFTKSTLKASLTF